MIDPSGITTLTEEMLLEKFNGDVYMAAAYAYAYVEHQKKRLEQSKIFNPGTPYMKALEKKIDIEFEWDLMTPWWKKVLVKVGLMKREVPFSDEELDEIYDAAKEKYSMIQAIVRIIGKLIGWAVLLFLIYFILGCMHAAFQGIIEMPDEDGGPSIKENWEQLFKSSE